MKVTITVSCSRTSRAARVQKGLTCPIGHIQQEDIAMNDNFTPSQSRTKQKVRSIHRLG